MYHWVLLCRLRHAARRSGVGRKADGDFIVAGGQGEKREPLPREVETRLLWLGLLESVPLASGVVVGLHLPAPAASLAAVALGVMGAVVLAWLLRRKVPEVPIELGGPGRRAKG